MLHRLVLSIEPGTVQTGTGKVGPTRKLKCTMAACAKILDIMLDNFYLLNKLQFVQILQYRQIIVDTKVVDHILKIS